MRPSISKTFQHGNVYFHPEYLMSSNIVMALAGDMMSVEDKTTIARTTWEALQDAGGGTMGMRILLRKFLIDDRDVTQCEQC